MAAIACSRTRGSYLAAGDCYSWLVSLLACLFLFLSSPTYGETRINGEKASVLVVVREDSSVHAEFLDGLSACYQSSNSPGPAFEIVSVDQFDGAKPLPGGRDVIAVGVEATRAIADSGTDSFFISALVPRVTTRHLMADVSGQRRPDVAFFLDQPIERRLSLIRGLLPEAGFLGVVLGPNSEFYDKEIRREAGLQGFEIALGKVGEGQQLSQVLPGILEKSDALLVLYDPVLTAPNAIRFLLYSAYQHRVPVFGYSEGYVKAGALAAVYSTAPELGCQVGEYLEQRAELKSRTTKGVGMEVHYPSYFQYSRNHSVARSFSGVTSQLPDDQPMSEGLDSEIP